MWYLTACKISGSLSFLNWIKNEMIFIVSLNNVGNINSEILYKIILFQERETNLNLTVCQVPHFIIVFIPYINLLNLSWRRKCLFWGNKVLQNERFLAFDDVFLIWPDVIQLLVFIY